MTVNDAWPTSSGAKYNIMTVTASLASHTLRIESKGLGASVFESFGSSH